jgi:hypothetical protein
MSQSLAEAPPSTLKAGTFKCSAAAIVVNNSALL